MDKNNTKNKIILIMIGLLILAIAVFFIFRVFNNKSNENSSQNNSNDNTIMISQIVQSFNNCDIVKRWDNSNSGNSFVANDSNNGITITAVMSGVTENYEYILDKNILSITLNQSDMLGSMATAYLIDSIGKLHGYKDGELLSTTLNNEYYNVTSKFTVENEGYEVEKYSDGTSQIKVDITKKIPLAN